jgi:hypothetical protein
MEEVIISEGGIGRKFLPVNKLKVNNQVGGATIWLPEDDVKVSDINITENGVFSAVEEELYAYNEVTVDVTEDITDPSDTGSVTGTDPDTGNDYEYNLNEDGNLDVSLIPSAIHIVVKPRKLKYVDGEQIDYVGMHVYLMDGNNKRFTSTEYPTGEIPFGELMLPEMYADASKATDEGSEYEGVTMQFAVMNSVKIASGVGSSYLFEIYTAYDAQDTVYGYGLDLFFETTSKVYKGVYICSKKPFGCIFTDIFGDHDRSSESYTYAGKTVYFSGRLAYQVPDFDVVEQSHPINDHTDKHDLTLQMCAWIVCYGDYKSGGQEIPVQWMRSDGEILEDTFEIEVGEGGEPGPPEPDPYDGVYDFEWQGHKYNFNRSLEPDEVHYSNGTVWQEWLGGQSPPYTVPQAVTMGLVIQVE